MKTLNDICIVEDKILTKMEGYFSPKPFYLIGGNNSGKTGFLWRLQEIIKDRTRITDLVILSNKNDFGYKYEDGPKTLREAFGRDVDLFDKILDCTWTCEFLMEYCDLDDPYEALDYYNEYDWRFSALVTVVQRIVGFYYINAYEKRRVVFALDNFGSEFGSGACDLRDVFIYRLMEILHEKYGKLESMVLITTPYNNYDFWVTVAGDDDERIEHACCGDKYFISDTDKREYLKFFSELRTLKKNTNEGDKEKMDIKAKLNESTELLNEAENEINTVKDIVIVAGMFDKDRDVEELTSILDTKSCGTLLIHKLDDCIILGGTASREWSTKAKSTDWNKQDNEFLVVLDINGPLFKKCTFLDLSRACEVLESSGLIDMVSSFIKSKR